MFVQWGHKAIQYYRVYSDAADGFGKRSEGFCFGLSS
jgi:hypothetical protein